MTQGTAGYLPVQQYPTRAGSSSMKNKREILIIDPSLLILKTKAEQEDGPAVSPDYVRLLEDLWLPIIRVETWLSASHRSETWLSASHRLEAGARNY